MAEVATKKSINVVSSKKSEVCGVQSNNGLIDLDDLTASNNQLISLCDEDDDDDLVLTNNTRNELDNEDKSLQELIESELALRICSSKSDDDIAEDLEEQSVPQPETIKRIILDRRPDPIDINAEFIAAESEHYALIEEPHQNGHVSPDAKAEVVKSEPVYSPDEEEEQVFVEQSEVVQETCDDDWLSNRKEPIEEYQAITEDHVMPATDVLDSSNVTNELIDTSISQSSATKEEGLAQELPGDENLYHTDADQKNEINADVAQDTCIEQALLSSSQQFSDNFDEAIHHQNQSFNNLEFPNEESPMNEHIGKLEDSPEYIEEKIPASLISQEKQPSEIIEDADSKLSEEHEEDPRCIREQFENSDDGILSQPEIFTETISTQEFLASERQMLSEEANQETPQIVASEITGSPAISILESESVSESPRDIAEEAQNPVDESSSELSASDSTFIEKTEIVVSDTSVTIFSETKLVVEHVDENLDSWTTVEEATKSADVEEDREMERSGDINEATRDDNEGKADDSFAPPTSPRAPLATPDETETSDVSNACDSESREETVTASSVVTSSKVGTKTKKKKIEGVAGNDATSPNLTPRTKKTKKSKKSDLEKENISVTQNYVSETSRSDQEKLCRERIATGVSIKQLCRSFGDISNMSDGDQAAFGKTSHAVETEEKSSFNKFDALSKKTVLHVRSVDAGKVQQQLNAVGQSGGEANTNCRSCGKVVFQMEQTKAEGLVWHKNCFRCVQCGKQLNVDNYESHESTLYCKPHFKELFQPKPVEESEQPASDKPDLGLEELSSLNVKSRFQVFEKATAENANEIERSPSQIAVKRSPSILSKLAKFQAKGMDIGVADESLNGIPYEESSESEDDVETEETEEVETEIIKAKRTTRERPISFSKMDDIKNRWESTSQQGRREIQREARKEEIAGIRSRLFMGKQGKMKEMYQQAVAGNDRVTKINAAEEIQHSATHARSIKERFERGEPIAASDDETDSKPKPEKADEEVIAAGISRKSRSLFLELDASAAKTGRPVTPVHPKTPTENSRRARDMDSPDREIYRDPDVVRADDRVDEVVHTDTARKMLSIFRQMEENACKEELPEGPKPLKRFTPPPEDKFAKATASDSEEDEDEENEESEGDESAEEKDPNYVRASDKVEDEFLKQAQNAARAKTLRAKFEHWEETDGKVSSHHIAEIEMAQGTGEQSSIESASSLRARFESLGSQNNESPRAPKVKVNRFV